MRKLIVNKAQCLDCNDTIESMYRHDFVTCSCGNMSVDGGWDYAKRLWKNDNCKELSVYEDDPHTKIREHLTRGGRGINGDEPLTYVLLKDMSNAWVKAVIDYEETYRPDNFFIKFFQKELEYRKENHIFVEDKN